MMNAEFEMTEDESIQFEKDYERFSIIQDENNFKTTWCLYEIENIEEDSDLSADTMTDGCHNNITVNLPNKKLTWLELWKHADMLFEIIGDSEHMFIESFELKGDTIEVGFGS
jgi:hypothetical protein